MPRECSARDPPMQPARRTEPRAVHGAAPRLAGRPARDHQHGRSDGDGGLHVLAPQRAEGSVDADGPLLHGQGGATSCAWRGGRNRDVLRLRAAHAPDNDRTPRHQHEAAHLRVVRHTHCGSRDAAPDDAGRIGAACGHDEEAVSRGAPVDVGHALTHARRRGGGDRRPARRSRCRATRDVARQRSPGGQRVDHALCGAGQLRIVQEHLGGPSLTLGLSALIWVV